MITNFHINIVSRYKVPTFFSKNSYKVSSKITITRTSTFNLEVVYGLGYAVKVSDFTALSLTIYPNSV